MRPYIIFQTVGKEHHSTLVQGVLEHWFSYKMNTSSFGAQSSYYKCVLDVLEEKVLLSNEYKMLRTLGLPSITVQEVLEHQVFFLISSRWFGTKNSPFK